MQEKEKGKPRKELTFKEDGNQDNHTWHDKTHGQLAALFQNYVKSVLSVSPEYVKGLAERGETWQPEEIIRSQLHRQTLKKDLKGDFWSPILRAWDVLAYDRYEPGSAHEWMAGHNLSKDNIFDAGPSIKLSDPLQVRTIDALADAFGLSHQQGQNEILIPKKLREYTSYRKSDDYRNRIAATGTKKIK